MTNPRTWTPEDEALLNEIKTLEDGSVMSDSELEAALGLDADEEITGYDNGQDFLRAMGL